MAGSGQPFIQPYDGSVGRSVFAVLLVIAFSSCGFGAAADQVGSIQGHVYSWSCGRPLEQKACNMAIADVPLRFEKVDTSKPYEVVTDKAGAYRINLPSGSYLVRREWTNTDSLNRPIKLSAPLDYGPGKITVKPGDRVVVDFALRAGARP